MTRNRLDQTTSPYLLQHKDNPVHWYPWGEEALDAARSTDKPILLSVGYAACHWCHVMAHESFEDPATADVMNELFINIKVDREERPDIDRIYMNAIHHLGEQGGWPLTMFLTPDGRPFWGGTYFPKTAQYGRPSFIAVMQEVARVYADEPEKISVNAKALHKALSEDVPAEDPFSISQPLVDEFANRLVQAIDMGHGGLRGAPKFPQTVMLTSLWLAWLRTGTPHFRDAVTTSLRNMAQGGIYDHIAGGFSRYSVDAIWLAPHFEKMLYDNALLVDLMTLVWQDTGDALLKIRVAETAEWTLSEMLAPDGGFAASLDADSEGEEGRYYVWTEDEIDTLLGDDADFFKSVYDVKPGGNWEGKTILNRLANQDLLPQDDEEKLKTCRERLQEARDRRVRPGWDDKVLSDWNGLMISALANAGRVFQRPQWHDAAVSAFRFVCESMTKDGRLLHSYRAGKAEHPATADGYANMIRAALVLYDTTFETRYIDTALAWLDDFNRHYWDQASGGYFFTADDAPALIVRTKTATDDAQPNGNATMISNLAKLSMLTGNSDHKARAEALLAAFAGPTRTNLFGHAGLINGYDALARSLQIVIAIPARQNPPNDVLEVIRRASLPERSLQIIHDGQDLPQLHPAHGKTSVDGRPAVYICRGQTCSLPVTDVNRLSEELGLRTA